jgi:hypothetical protein
MLNCSPRKKRNRRRLSPNLDRALRFEGLEGRNMLATIMVSTNVDGQIDPIDSNVTLREAIAFVNLQAQPSNDEIMNHIIGTLGVNDKIVFDSSLNGQTIRLQYIDEASTHTVALSINRNVTIDATMLPQGLTLDAIEGEIDWNMPGEQRGDQDGLRVFDIGGGETSNLSVTLAGLTMTGGNPWLGGAGAIFYQAESGMLTIRDSKIVGNLGHEAGDIWTKAA